MLWKRRNVNHIWYTIIIEDTGRQTISKREYVEIWEHILVKVTDSRENSWIKNMITSKSNKDSTKQLFDDATAGKSVKEDSSNLKLVVIIFAVVSLLVIIVKIIVFAVFHKKVAKAFRPTDDGKEDSADILHPQNWQAMSSGSKTELLASDMLNPALMGTIQGRGSTLIPLNKDSST
ncbi:unnamed protein product [Mytilus coruscus]|uniref:Uncharacterized protein n=1 Tax=Mytilus coruscus TaxID=42192 RepID=A0A6J8E9W6_MYTCO|nr:unnamed protein product [Mytilus coruscus]